MPLYEYECEACGHRFEVIQKLSDGPPAACPTCGKGPLQRLLSSPAIQFKGTGWYVTDYAGKGKSGGESGRSETKSAAKTEPGGGESAGGESKKGDTPASPAPSKTE